MQHKGPPITYGSLPETGFLRLKQIIGDLKVDPPIPPIIPISKSSVWAFVREGRFPQPIKLSPRVTVWRVEDIRKFIEEDGREREDA